MIESIIHILEILTALAIYSVFKWLIAVTESALNQRADNSSKTHFVIQVNTKPVRYWRVFPTEGLDPNDLRYWCEDIDLAWKWSVEEDAKKYMAQNNVPGNTRFTTL